MRTSLALSQLKAGSPTPVIQNFVVPTVVLTVFGKAPRSFRLPRYGLLDKSHDSHDIRRIVLLAMFGRTRVDMDVAGRASSVRLACIKVAQRISDAVSGAARSSAFLKRFQASMNKPLRESQLLQLESFFRSGAFYLLKEADIVRSFRMVRGESVAKKIIDA